VARSILLGTLVLTVKQLAGKEGDDSIGNPEWRRRIGRAYATEIHGRCLEVGMNQFEAEQTITADGSSTYALPNAYLSTIGVEFQVDSGGRRRPLDPIMPQERAGWVGQSGGEAAVYLPIGTNISLYPKPSSGTYFHIYVPQPTDYTASDDSTSIDLITADGEEALLWKVVSESMDKSESNARTAEGRYDRARERFDLFLAQHRHVHEPRRTITDYPDRRGYDPADWKWSR
jgi:hypothetical protein